MRLNIFIIAFTLSIIYVNIDHVDSAVRVYDFKVRYFTGYPDGVRKRILGVNGKFPGPTIRARLGDTLVVNVQNRIQSRENTSIHWHGIEQVLTPFQDGPEQVTQCPILYGSTYTYTFELKQSGTYWWHSHHSWQYTEGYWGVLIVENTPEVYRQAYDDEITITVNDWYHKPASELTDWYLSAASKGNEPIPDSVLLNGRGSYPCANARTSGYICDHRKQTTTSPSVFTVKQYKTYRIRVINTSAMTAFYFSIDGHKLETIEVDGVDTVRVAPVDEVRLSSAMRYSFLVKMNAPTTAGNTFWIRVKAFTIPFKTNPNINPFVNEFEPEVKAILKYGRTYNRPSIINSLSPDDSLITDNSLSGIIPISIDSATSRPPPPSPTVKGQGRPETHGINWNNVTEVLQLVQNIQNTAEAESLNNNEFTLTKSVQRLNEFDSDSSLSSNLQEFQSTLSTSLQESQSIMNSNLQESQSIINSNLGQSALLPASATWLNSRTAFPTTQPNTPASRLNPNDCRPYPGNKLAPASYDELVTLNAEFMTDASGIKWSTINNIIYKIGQKPVIFNVIQNEPIPTYVNPIKISLGKVIQVVINNRRDDGHPFHLHGHTFWVVGTGVGEDGDYDEARNANDLRRDGVRRDTTSIPPHSWAVIRFLSDNPGAWLFHCHINWHLQAGLGAVFIEGEDIARLIYQNVPTAAKRMCETARIQIS